MKRRRSRGAEERAGESDMAKELGKEGVGEGASTVEVLDNAAFEECYLGGIDGGGRTEGMAGTVGIVETGGGFEAVGAGGAFFGAEVFVIMRLL